MFKLKRLSYRIVLVFAVIVGMTLTPSHVTLGKTCNYEDQRSPLFTAVRKNEIPAIICLLKKGQDLNKTDYGQTILETSLKHYDPETIKLLYMFGAKAITLKKPFMQYITEDYGELLRQFRSIRGQKNRGELKADGVDWRKAYKYYQDQLDNIIAVTLLSLEHGANVASYHTTQNKNSISQKTNLIQFISQICSDYPYGEEQTLKLLDQILNQSKGKLRLTPSDMKELEGLHYLDIGKKCSIKTQAAFKW